jgi:hypothetical protein
MLVHHPDSSRDGITRILDFEFFAANEYLSLIRLVQTVEDVHQGGFASTIFTKQGVDFALLKSEVDLIVSQHTGEAFRDVLEL